MKLYYFPTPGRAETSRLMFVLAGTAFEDKHITGAEWAAFKAESPFGQLPFLELDCGKKIAQQIAIENYVAKLTGHEPEDAVVRAKGDEIRGLIEECWGLIIPTLSIADLDARIAARKELMAGALKKKLEFINTCVAAAPGNFLGGDKVSLADLSVFTVSSTLTSGILDGIPTDFLPGFPEIKALRNKVASLDGVKSYYANNEKRASFRPDA